MIATSCNHRTWLWDPHRVRRLVSECRPARGVAQANDRYYDLPRGWRSDRGRVHVMLGPPDMIRPQFGRTGEADVWTYYTIGPRAEGRPFGSSLGEVTVAFVRTGVRQGYQIYGGFAGPGMLPTYVRDMFRYSKQAAVVDPFLELSTGG